MSTTTTHMEEAGGGASQATVETLFAVDEDLPPLPAGLVAQAWSEVRDSTLGARECAMCLEDMDGEVVGPVVRLHCRHAYCEVCVRQLLERAEAGGGAGAAVCPQCRKGIL